MRCRTRTLGARRILDDLDGQVLSDVDFLMWQHESLRRVMRQAVADVEERVLLLADVDESRLHAREDVLHMSLVDIADEVRVRGALHLHALEFPVLNARHARFLGYDIHENLLHRFLLSSPLGQRKIDNSQSAWLPASCALYHVQLEQRRH